MTDGTRTDVRTFVVEHPGVHFNGIARRLDLAPGQLQYHLRRLVDDDAVVREAYYGRTHYYPPDTDPWPRGVLALLRRETARDIVFDLLEHEPSRPDDVADRLGIARSTLEWHLGHLVEQEIVRKRHDDAGRVTLVVERPERTVDLLALVEPSFPERLVDRFERLVDQLLADE